MDTVYGYRPKATILTKLTTTAASTTDSYKTHFLKNNIQTSYQDSLCSSMILTQEHITLRHNNNPPPKKPSHRDPYCSPQYIQTHFFVLISIYHLITTILVVQQTRFFVCSHTTKITMCVGVGRVYDPLFAMLLNFRHTTEIFLTHRESVS